LIKLYTHFCETSLDVGLLQSNAVFRSTQHQEMQGTQSLPGAQASGKIFQSVYKVYYTLAVEIGPTG